MVRTQALVQWSSMPESLATWEDEAQLRARFPRSPAWEQAATEEGGNVTTRTGSRRDTPHVTAPHAEAEPRVDTSNGSIPYQRPQRLRRPSSRLDPAVWDLK
jgi:hypothetical protein